MRDSFRRRSKNRANCTAKDMRAPAIAASSVSKEAFSPLVAAPEPQVSRSSPEPLHPVGVAGSDIIVVEVVAGEVSVVVVTEEVGGSWEVCRGALWEDYRR